MRKTKVDNTPLPPVNPNSVLVNHPMDPNMQHGAYQQYPMRSSIPQHSHNQMVLASQNNAPYGYNDGSLQAVPYNKTSPSIDAANSPFLNEDEEGTDDKKTSTFLLKTFNMVSDPKNTAIVSWNSSGDEFVVRNEHEFASNILPVHFRHKNFSSFVRQLNFYGFSKRSTPNQHSHFKHACFRRGRRDLLPQIKRKMADQGQQGNVKDSLALLQSQVLDLQSKHQETYKTQQQIIFMLSKILTKDDSDRRLPAQSYGNAYLPAPKHFNDERYLEFDQNQESLYPGKRPLSLDHANRPSKKLNAGINGQYNEVDPSHMYLDQTAYIDFSDHTRAIATLSESLNEVSNQQNNKNKIALDKLQGVQALLNDSKASFFMDPLASGAMNATSSTAIVPVGKTPSMSNQHLITHMAGQHGMNPTMNMPPGTSPQYPGSAAYIQSNDPYMKANYAHQPNYGAPPRPGLPNQGAVGQGVVYPPQGHYNPNAINNPNAPGYPQARPMQPMHTIPPTGAPAHTTSAMNYPYQNQPSTHPQQTAYPHGHPPSGHPMPYYSYNPHHAANPTMPIYNTATTTAVVSQTLPATSITNPPIKPLPQIAHISSSQNAILNAAAATTATATATTILEPTSISSPDSNGDNKSALVPIVPNDNNLPLVNSNANVFKSEAIIEEIHSDDEQDDIKSVGSLASFHGKISKTFPTLSYDFESSATFDLPAGFENNGDNGSVISGKNNLYGTPIVPSAIPADIKHDDLSSSKLPQNNLYDQQVPSILPFVSPFLPNSSDMHQTQFTSVVPNVAAAAAAAAAQLTSKDVSNVPAMATTATVDGTVAVAGNEPSSIGPQVSFSDIGYQGQKLTNIGGDISSDKTSFPYPSEEVISFLGQRNFGNFPTSFAPSYPVTGDKAFTISLDPTRQLGKSKPIEAALNAATILPPSLGKHSPPR